MTNPLIVPVQLKAYLVNSGILDGEEDPGHFGHWHLNFHEPKDLTHPPEPYPFGLNPNWDKPSLGVYLHWSLPDALRAAGDKDTGFPLVPNRWLVVRSRRQNDKNGVPETAASPDLHAWVVQSDYMPRPNGDDPGGISPYPVKNSDGEWKHGTIGRVFDLTTETWSEPGTAMFLTAVGPGIPAFCGYEPYSRGVFSFHDDLGLSDDEKAVDYVGDQATLDYLAVGWYSDQGKDILTGPGNLDALLEKLAWETSGQKPDRASLYAGTALRMKWDKTGPRITGNRPTNPDDVWLSVGYNTADAQTAPGLQHTEEVAVGRLFQAFLTDKFEQLELDPEKFDDVMHSSWFAAHNTDHAWHIVDQPGIPDRPVSPAELATERTWLAELNSNQYNYDHLMRYATGLRQRLYDLWRLRKTPAYDDWDCPGGKPDNWPSPDDKINSLAASLVTVKQQIKDILKPGLCAKTGQYDCPGLPHGDTEEELEESIKKYAECHNLDLSKRALKCVPLPPFHSPTDPVVVIGGVNAEKPKTPGPLPCRTPGQLIYKIHTGGGTQTSSVAMPSNVGGTPPEGLRDAYAGLFTEFTLLSLAAANGPTSTDNDLASNLKTLDLKLDFPTSDRFQTSSSQPTAPGRFVQEAGCWDQTWEPVYLLWEIQYYPVPMTASGGYHWVFDARTNRYQLQQEGSPDPVRPVKLNGRSALTDVPQFLVQGRIDQHLRTYSGAPRQALQELADQSDLLGEISQTVEGFNRSLLQRMTGIGITPTSDDQPPSLAGLFATCLDSEQPDPAPYPDIGFPDPAPDKIINGDQVRFSPVLAGQFVFTRAIIADSLGRHITIIDENNWAKRPPYRSASVTPGTGPDGKTPLTVGKTGTDDDPIAACYVQLAPRVLQPTRLRFDFVSANDSGTVIDDPPTVPTSTDPAPNPVVGWLLAAHLTRSLLIYDPDGRGVIEGRLGLAPGQQTAVDWVPLPDCPYKDPLNEKGGDFDRACPELFGFLKGLQDGGTDAYLAIMEHIDDSAWHVRPPGDAGAIMAPLAGQPVVLLRARLTLETDSLTVCDPSWDKAQDFAAGAPDYLKDSWRWNIRLGGGTQNGDGLIGYYTSQGEPADTSAGAKTDYSLLRTNLPSLALPPLKAITYTKPIDARDLALPVNRVPSLDNTSKPVIAYVTLLADPWRDISAFTDILPTATVHLADHLVRGPLSQLRIAFRTGPLIAGNRPVPTAPPPKGNGGGTDDAQQEQQTAVVMPCPSAWTGTWSWNQPQRAQTNNKNNSQSENTPLAWDAPYPIVPAETTARLDQAPPTIRTGYLTLATAPGQEPDDNTNGKKKASGTPPPPSTDTTPASPSEPQP